MPEIDWRHLPSLSALRAFEATARLGSFAAAARALNVTHPAVAQQVRTLEAELGVPLVRREGRGLALTAEGTALAATLGDGFATIALGVAALKATERNRGLRVSCTPSFAQGVLLPRIAEFWRLHPDVPVSLVPDNRVVDLVAEGFDLAIRTRFSVRDDPDAEFLAQNHFGVVGAPSLLGDAPDLAALPWLLNTGDRTEFDWLRAAGYDPAKLTIIDMENGALAVAGATLGYGLIFATDAVVRAEVEAGKLRQVPFPGLPRTYYYIVTPPGPRRPAAAAFAQWLRSLVRGSGAVKSGPS